MTSNEPRLRRDSRTTFPVNTWTTADPWAEQRHRDPDFAERAVREGANLQASEALKANVVNYGALDLRDRRAVQRRVGGRRKRGNAGRLPAAR